MLAKTAIMVLPNTVVNRLSLTGDQLVAETALAVKTINNEKNEANIKRIPIKKFLKNKIRYH